MKLSLQFGALAPPLSRQLSNFSLPPDDVNNFQKDIDAITRCAVRGYLTGHQKVQAHKKLFAAIKESIEKL